MGILFLGAAGCTNSEFDVRPVRGQVTIDGQPMTAGRVMFAPAASGGKINAGKPAFGRIGGDGSYTLTTYTDDDGAVVGEHSVTVFDASETPQFSRIVLPGHRKVDAVAENVINLAITADEVRKYGVKP